VIQVQLKLQLRPAQERQLERWLWRLTGAYNWAIRKIELDAKDGIYHSAIDMLAMVNGHSVRVGVPSDALHGTIRTAHGAWQRCLKGLAKRPALKSRRNRLNGITFPHGRLKVEPRRVRLPILGFVRCHKQAVPVGLANYARIVRRASGWYVCLFIQADPIPVTAIGHASVGIDPGFSSLLTLSTGEVVDHPHELRAGAARLAQAQRGGRRRLTARLHERQANRRRDRNHKLSRKIVAENALIAWSKDRTKALQRVFGKSVASASHTQLRMMLAYKSSRIGGRQFIEVDSRNSTRTCSACGALTGPTGYAGLKVRQWSCACGAHHDRDVNAALNALRAGLGDSLKRVGDDSSGIAA
jgi:putative transposase